MKALSIDESCKAIGCGRTKLYQLINAGKIKAKKLDKNTVILDCEIDSFLDSLEAYIPKNSN